MSNLSDLLPAGAAAKQLTFTDSGSGISSKAPVVLNSDGTVSAVTGGTGSVGSSTQMNSVYYIANSNGRNAVYDTSNDKVVVFYTDYNGTPSRLGYAVVGTVSSGSISFGTPVVVASAVGMWDFGVAFDSTANKVIITYRDATNTEFRSQVGTVSGTSISFGSAQQIGSINYSSEVDCIYDATADRVVTMVTNSGNGAVFVGQVSGTSITWGSAQTLSGADGRPRLVYDPDEGKTICVYRTASSDHYLTGAVATISSSTATFGTPVTGISSAMDYLAVAYDTGSNKIVAGGTLSSGGHTVALVGSVSGTSITWGSYDFAYIGTSYYTSISYDVTANKTIITFTTGSFHAKYNVATVSGTTISFPGSGSVALVSVSNTFYGYTLYDPDTQQNILTYGDSTNSNYGESLVYTITYTNLSAQSFVGVADSAISASAAGSVIVQGGTVSGVASGTGPSAGANATYAPTPDDPYRYSMCYDTANDKVIIAYNDEANSYYLYACVGTVTGNAISWGTVVAVDETATMDQIQLTYDTNADRVLLVFRDQGTGGDLSGRVGTVSGTTISFGSKTTGTPHPSSLTSIYDPTEQKHLLSYLDNNNSNYGYSCVATVTGGATNTVAFGTQVQFSSDGNLSGDNLPMCYYTSETKIIMKYDITFTGRYAVACTISGTSVSFGTAVLEYAWGTYGQMSSTNITYDSTANKAVSVDGVNASPHGLYAAVISLSGATITWGTPVVVNANSATDTFKHAASIAYSSAGNNLLIAYSDDSNSSYLYGVSGTLSGTSTTWGTPVAVRSVSVASDQETDLIYDPDSQNFVVAYRTATPAGESNVVSIGDLPVVVGTKYYVTTSGGFSSSADTPSVNAGLAISTTSLLLNGDS